VSGRGCDESPPSTSGERGGGTCLTPTGSSRRRWSTVRGRWSSAAPTCRSRPRTRWHGCSHAGVTTTVCLAGDADRLPWLVFDEAHVRFDGIARPALDRLFTRGRAPGVSVVCATQRPAALPATAVSQADLLVAHTVTSEADVSKLAATRPTYLDGGLRTRLPDERGVALVVDDTSEAAHTVCVRARRTPHGGETPRALEISRE